MKEAILRLSLQGWLFAHMPDGWSGRMSPAYYQASAAKILPPSYRCSSGGRSPSPTGNGERRDSSPPPPDASTWVGECLTLNIPEFNNFRDAPKNVPRYSAAHSKGTFAEGEPEGRASGCAIPPAMRICRICHREHGFAVSSTMCVSRNVCDTAKSLHCPCASLKV